MKMAYETPRSKEGQTNDEEFIAFVDCSSCSEDLFFIRAFSSSPEKTQEAVANAWNTRAVPDVPEIDVNRSTTKDVECQNNQSMTHNANVPELDRYRPAVYMEPCLGGMFNDEFGEYVRHSQAAEIIAADRASLEQAKKEINTLLVSYVREHFFENKTFQPLDSLIGQISQLDNAITITRDFKNRAEAAEAKLAQINDQKPVGYIIKHPRFTDDFQTYELSEGDISNGYTQVPLYASPAPSADLKTKCDRYERTLRGIAELSATGMSYGDQVFAVTSSRAALKVEASNDKA